MGNGIQPVTNGGAAPQITNTQSKDQSKQAPRSEEKQTEKSVPLSEEAKASQKSLHQFDGAAKEASLRSSIKPNPLADPTRDMRQKAVKEMIKDGKLDAKEAQDVINLAKDDAKLPANEKDPKNLQPALINLYVRSGVSMEEAKRLSGKTLEMAKDGKGTESVSTEPAKEKITAEKADKIRLEAEESTKNNAAATKNWTVDQIKKDRAGFVRNVVQMDGDKDTKSDYKSCPQTSLMGGIILSKPEAAQDLAKKLQSDKGVKEFPELQKEPAKSAVTRMASGNFSAKDVSVVSNGLYASTRYMKEKDGQLQLSEGVSMLNQMALVGRLKNIGFDMPIMRQDTYGTLNRMGTHVTAFANNTGYDPWPYPGTNGQATLNDGDAAARNQGLAIGPRYGMPSQPRAMLERMKYDGQGGIILERHVVDNKEVNPPLKARYTFNSAENRWERDPSVKVASGQEAELPQYIPVEHAKRKDMKLEDI
jgi:hypothetical protein